MMLEEKTRITGWKAWPQSAQDTCRSKEGWLALLCANPYPKSQSVVFIQTLAGFDFWDVEDYGRLVAVCDTSVPFWSWQVHFLGLKVSVHGKRLDPKSMRRDPHCFCTLLLQLFTPLQSKDCKIITFTKQTRFSTFSTFSTVSIFSTKKVGNQKSNQIFQVFPSNFQSWEDCSLAYQVAGHLRCSFLIWNVFF